MRPDGAVSFSRPDRPAGAVPWDSESTPAPGEHSRTRRLIKVMPEDVEQTARIFDLLLGDDLIGRKTHIADHGHEFLELADIS